ncbi:MAG: hypothetical protein ACYTHM_23285 [Planctomycetota bacterium]|jgi:hypothetical protein
MPPEVTELAHPWKPLIGTIHGLTPELEKEFRFGQSVISLEGKYRLGGNLKGGSSAMWIPAERESFDAYNAWRDRDGIPKVKDRRAFKRLSKLLRKHGVDLVNGSWSGMEQISRNFSEKRGYIYAVTTEILSCLPASHLDRDSFQVLQIGGWGPDGAKASAYENGKIMMYDFAVNGARRTYVGLLLHEMGHAHEAALSEAQREVLRRAFVPISRARAVLGVEFLVDARARQLYQLRVYEEFAAETYLIYTSQGEVLRSFVRGQSSPVKGAWEDVYGVFRDTFEGVEYR